MVQYRYLQKKDFSEIRRVALASWLYTYRKIYSVKTMKEKVAAYYSDSGLEKARSDTRQHLAWFCVVTSRHKIIGYAHIRKRRRKWELFRIYFLPSAHGKGIGSELIERGELFLQSKAARKYVVYPNSKNFSGIAFYEKMGFTRKPGYAQDKTHPCFEKQLL